MKKKVKFLFYTLTHPMDGFYEIRHREAGSIWLAMLVVFAAAVAFCVDKRYASFVVNTTDTRTVNSLMYIGSMFLLYFLFCVGNWSVTCLTNGEGRMQDILTATGYGMLPIPLMFFPATLLSQVIAADEEVFYQMLIYVSVIWALALIIIGNMTVHNYTLTKEIQTLIFTVLAMCVILFIVLLFYSVFSQMTGFFKSVYTELIYRI